MMYHKGDIIDLYFMGAGYLTGGNTGIYVNFPLTKPLGSDVKSLIVDLQKLELRQGGKYLAQDPTGVTCNILKNTNDFYRLMLSKTTGFGGENNGVVGIFAQGKVTLN